MNWDATTSSPVKPVSLVAYQPRKKDHAVSTENNLFKKVHFHLVAGEVIFVQTPTDENTEPQSGSIRLNGILETDDGLITAARLGKAQQILQMHFFNRMKDANLQVIDVFVYNISNLGRMSQKQFHKPPEGMKLQEASQGEVPEGVFAD